MEYLKNDLMLIKLRRDLISPAVQTSLIVHASGVWGGIGTIGIFGGWFVVTLSLYVTGRIRQVTGEESVFFHVY